MSQSLWCRHFSNMMNQEKETLLQAGVGWQDEMRKCNVTGERVRFREKNQTKKCEGVGKEGRKNREKKKWGKTGWQEEWGRREAGWQAVDFALQKAIKWEVAIPKRPCWTKCTFTLVGISRNSSLEVQVYMTVNMCLWGMVGVGKASKYLLQFFFFKRKLFHTMKYFSKPWFQNTCSTSPSHIKEHAFLPKLSDLTLTSLSTESALELSLAPCVSCL